MEERQAPSPPALIQTCSRCFGEPRGEVIPDYLYYVSDTKSIDEPWKREEP